MVTFEEIVNKYNNYTLDGTDPSIKEIDILQFLWFDNPSFDAPSEAVQSSEKLVLVLVEARLLNDINTSIYKRQDLLARLLNFKNDLLREGWQTKFLKAQLYAGPVRQEGRTLLALREFFKSIRNAFSNFEGVILIGSFPDARMTHLWPDYVEGSYAGVKAHLYGEQGFLVAHPRYDIVLADLHGNWQNIYHETLVLNRHSFYITDTTTVSFSGPDNSQVILENPAIVINDPSQECPTPGPVSVNDTFFIQDTSYEEKVLPDANGTIKVEFSLFAADPEVTIEDKEALPNPIAQPDICISRINARSIAVKPPSDLLLDARGKPQITPIALIPGIDLSPESWVRDPILERTLLIDYFDRNHAFRRGTYADVSFGVSVIESGDYGTGDVYDGLNGMNAPMNPITNNATVLDLIRWLKDPSVFRVFSSHADCDYTLLLEDDPNVPWAEAEAGGHPWRWIVENFCYIPSFKGHFWGDFYVYRTLWENRQLVNVPGSLMIHLGCNVYSIKNGNNLSYNDQSYGTFQNAECLLFYGNQLAVLCHVALWNRGPCGFGYEFGSSESATFGDGLKGFYKSWSDESSLKRDQVNRKRPYEWGIVGDWTLRKYYPAPPVSIPPAPPRDLRTVE